MKAPDKIYVHVRTDPRPSITFSEVLEKNSTNEKYIRKDALLEWLDGKMTVEEATEGIVGGYDLALKDVIKHIESL